MMELKTFGPNVRFSDQFIYENVDMSFIHQTGHRMICDPRNASLDINERLSVAEIPLPAFYWLL